MSHADEEPPVPAESTADAPAHSAPSADQQTVSPSPSEPATTIIQVDASNLVDPAVPVPPPAEEANPPVDPGSAAETSADPRPPPLEVTAPAGEQPTLAADPQATVVAPSPRNGPPAQRPFSTDAASDRTWRAATRLQQEPEERSTRLGRLCGAEPRTEACSRFLLPNACAQDNPFTDDSPFSCEFAQYYNPCFQDFTSEACRLFRDDAINPCFARPDGPACLQFAGGTPPDGCSYPPDYPPPQGQVLSPICSAYVAALIDLCETREERCPGPFGGSRETLALAPAAALREIGDGEGDDPGDGDEKPGEQDQGPETDRGATVSAAFKSSAHATPTPRTGLEVSLLLVTGLTLLGFGVLIQRLGTGPAANTATRRAR